MQESEECLYNINMALTKVSSLGVQSGVGGTDWQSVVTASTLNAESGKGYPIDTSSNTCTITMPSNPSAGDTIVFMDYARNFGTNKIIINPNSKNFQGNTSPNPEYNTSGQSITCVYINATKGWIPQVDDDVTMETPQAYSVDFLCIAGGGGGSGNGGAGGSGAGGYRNSYNNETSGGGGSSETALSLTPATTYTITIGAGGTGQSSNTGLGNQGNDTTIAGSDITNIVSLGGGVGGSTGGGDANGTVGGSGGGSNNSGDGSAGTTGQGYAGGYSNHSQGGGGGGGAGSVGGNNSGANPGNGGSGQASSITGSSVTRGGGGGGATYQGTQSSGGSGGGGDGGKQDPVAQGSSGTANTGGGAGGKYAQAPHNAGGSGVVILRMATANYSGTTSGSPSVSTSGSDTILVFNASGSYTA